MLRRFNVVAVRYCSSIPGPVSPYRNSNHAIFPRPNRSSLGRFNPAIWSLDHEYGIHPSPIRQWYQHSWRVTPQCVGVWFGPDEPIDLQRPQGDTTHGPQHQEYLLRFLTGTTSLSSWLAEHPRAVFVPPPQGRDFREAHVFDFSPKYWQEQTPRAKRNLLSPVATPEDTVVDCKGHRYWLFFFWCVCCVARVSAALAVLCFPHRVRSFLRSST